MSGVEAVLAAHAGYEWWPMTREFICTCETSIGRSYPDAAHLAHVVAELAKAGIGDVAEAEARGAERIRAAIQTLIGKWTGCWCGPQLAYDHDPRVQDCPQHGDNAADHFCGAIVADLRAALTEADQ